MGDVGSLEWGRRTGGVLSEQDRADLLAQGQVVLQRLQSDRVLDPVALNAVPIPDSALAKDAEALCADVSDPWLVSHCARTYLFGAGWGVATGVRFDAEVLYVASLLHDLFVTPTYESRMPVECFAVAGGMFATEFFADHGEAERAELVGEAISRHLNVDVPIEDGPESHLLSMGVTIDVSGLYLNVLPTGFAEQVVARHPRTGAASGIAGVIKRQSGLHPETRSAFLNSTVGLAERALEHPLGD